MLKLYSLRIPKIDGDSLKKYMSLVSKQRQDKVNRQKNEAKRHQALFAAVMLRAILCENLKLKNSELQFGISSYGKPYLLNENLLHFSISHTEGLVSVAVSDKNVGVDCEKIRAINKKLCERYFTDQEAEYVNSSDSDYEARFFEIWTMKEAFGKYKGDGFLKIASVSVLSDDIKGKFSVYNDGGYVISCISESEKDNVISQSDSEILLNKFINDKNNVI